MFDTKAFKTLFDSKGMKQIQLAEMTKIPQNAISRYLQGIYQPKADRIKLLADALGVSVETLTIKEITNSDLVQNQKRQICYCPYCGEKLGGATG